MSNSASQSKVEERRARNLASANISRQRRREQISALTQEKARLTEANALLRSRLQLTDISLPALQALVSSEDRGRSGTVELGPALQQIVRKSEMSGEAVVDLLDRTISGSKNKGPPLDAEAAARMAEATKKIPRDVKRPLKYVNERVPSSTKSKSKGSSSGNKKR